MALGTLVICSDRACLPEVVGDAGLVLPLNTDAWAGALDLVISKRSQYLEASTQRLENFTAEASGTALADAYRMVLK
jgi:glycosyltransferase involved in cell wall biosynthesis